MEKDKKKVEHFFHHYAATFDAIYDEDKGMMMRLLDHALRPDMVERFRLSMQHTVPHEGTMILDLGCGPGRYAVEYAKRGVKKVIGVDFSKGMIEIAEQHASKNGVKHICEFLTEDILKFQAKEKFDTVLAIGVFDYISDPLALLRHMKNLSKGRIAASFPSFSMIRSPIRWIRYKLNNCPVYFYDRNKIQGLLEQAGFTKFEIIKIKGMGMDYFVWADASSAKG